MKHAFGYVPDLLDARDHLFAPKVEHLPAPPPSVDLTAKMPPVVDQGQLGSCVGNGTAGVVDFLHCNKPAWAGPSSRLAIYYGARSIEGTVKQDAGAQIRDGIKTVVKMGASLEKLWPYVISKFKTKPPAAAMADAAKRKITSYMRLNTQNDRVQCLAAGFPFVFGFSVPASFESASMAKTGKMKWDTTEHVIGGHCVVGVGYDLAKKVYVCRNSWGASWGLADPTRRGYFEMDMAYCDNPAAASDFWTVRA